MRPSRRAPCCRSRSWSATRPPVGLGFVGSSPRAPMTPPASSRSHTTTRWPWKMCKSSRRPADSSASGPWWGRFTIRAEHGAVRRHRAAVYDAGGALLDVNDGFAKLDQIPAGGTSPFSISFGREGIAAGQAGRIRGRADQVAAGATLGRRPSPCGGGRLVSGRPCGANGATPPFIPPLAAPSTASKSATGSAVIWDLAWRPLACECLAGFGLRKRRCSTREPARLVPTGRKARG